MSDERGHDGRFWVGLFIGGFIGAVILFFLGTKEGKKTGKFLQRKTDDLLGDLEDKVGDLEKKGKEFIREGEAIKDEVLETLDEKKGKITEDLTDKLDSALAQIEDLQEKGLATTATLRKRIFKNTPKRS